MYGAASVSEWVCRLANRSLTGAALYELGTALGLRASGVVGRLLRWYVLIELPRRCVAVHVASS